MARILVVDDEQEARDILAEVLETMGPMLMAVFAVSLVAKSTSLSQMADLIAKGHSLLRPSLVFALLAFVLIALAETGRVPVDNPATHLELTMIHEAMILEYSGRHLALIEWASMMKLFLFTTLGIASFFPRSEEHTSE